MITFFENGMEEYETFLAYDSKNNYWISATIGWGYWMRQV
jgi:hypothetical protein